MNTIQDFIENFHKELWITPEYLEYMNIWSSYQSKNRDSHYSYRHKPNYNSFYEIHDCRAIDIPSNWGKFGSTNDSVISEHMLDSHKAIIKKYVGDNKQLHKKFVIGDYTFYICFNSGLFNTESSSAKDCDYQVEDFSVYIEYHGYTNRILNLYKQEQYRDGNISNRGITVKGYYILLEFLINCNEDLKLQDYNFKEVFGEWENQKFRYLDSITPKHLSKFTKEKNKYWPDQIDIKQSNLKIDFDHFINMFTNKGIYKPNKKIYELLNRSDYNYSNKLLVKVKKLKDLGVDIVQFQNNSAFDITKHYDLTGVNIKCSESVLKQYSNLRKFFINKDVADDITKKETEEKIRREKERKQAIADDTYTLYQYGKPVLKDVLSHKITEYFEYKEGNAFEKDAINEAKKVFNATSEIDTIYFMSYGIYTYTELSGEKFVNYEDLESINKCMGIKLPKRILTLLEHSQIEFPYFDTDDKNVDFDRGATYIGVKKQGDNYTVVYESGDQNI